ncbi:MAG TPA: hypothetical protein VFM88_06445 [Vicinamibacteria bacterium]|nr:hypothetical protein [Vicinamibacteria bacterium]
MTRSAALAVLLSAVAGLAFGAALRRFGPAPIASIAAGSEDAFFHEGLYERELPPGGEGPIRWTGRAASLRFEDLPEGPVAIEVRLRSNAAPVLVAVNGQVRGAIDPSGPRAVLEAAVPRGGRITVELRTETMQRGERHLGALLGFVRVTPLRPSAAPGALGLRLGAAAGLAAAAALAAGLGALPGAAVGGGTALLAAMALWPHGLGCSAYSGRLPWLLALAVAFAALGARLALRRAPSGSGVAGVVLASLAVAFGVNGVAATSPVMVASDVVFHAHVLRDVAGGDWFPTSVTQHARPFRIPYGSAFYALLAPLARWGQDPVALVRAGAGLGGCLAAVALLWLLLPLGASRAALAVLLLQVLPGSFDVYSAGNLSNAFGQSATLMFLAWWSGGTPLGAALGGALLALAALSHLSSAIVLVPVVAALLMARRGRPGRARALALLVGLAAAAWYYGHYAGLVLEQAPRLLEGGGQGRGGVVGFTGVLAHQAFAMLRDFGVPVLALLPFARYTGGAEVERDVRAYACGALAPMLPALVSPVAVRYLLALGPAVACLAAEGACRLRARGGGGRLAVAALLLAQAGLAAASLVNGIVFRYR